MAGYPDSVRIREVGPRDGFQNEPEVIATADKVRLIEMLIAAGLKRIEVTSFVRPDVIPQLADGAEVLAALERPDDVSFSVLIPNERGLDNALAVRDRGCTDDGCDRPPGWCDVHHEIPWYLGGETNLENCKLKCRLHHRKVHEARGDGRAPP